jgi:hypothetical protein
MSNEVYAFALDSAIKEIKNICPDVTNIFVFEENAQTIAKDADTNQDTINKTVDAFHAIKGKTETSGGLEAVTIQGSEGRVNIASINNLYLVTVTSREADEKFVSSLTRVLIPTVVKLVDQFPPAWMRNDEAPAATEPEPIWEPIEEPIQESIEEPIRETAEYDYQEETFEEAEQDEQETPIVEEAAAEETVESVEEVQAEDFEENGLVLPEPPVTQVIVESLGRLQFKSDTVRIDYSILYQWNDLYGDREIQEVDLDALNGKTIRCKFSVIKDSKYQGKGVIQIPDKIQAALETCKGKLVMVKPVVE